MIIRNKRRSTDVNAFEAYDDFENYLGEAHVEKRYWPLVSEKTPVLFTIRESGDELASDALLGAATAHALYLARRAEEKACIRVEVLPDRQEKLASALQALGFTGKSAVLRMEKELDDEEEEVELPEGLTVVYDYLNDEEECRFYLERMNALFDCGWDDEKLQSVREKENFRRILLIDESGAAAEMITWSEDGVGVAENLWVHPDWRGMGAGRFLLASAGRRWIDNGLVKGRMDVWSRLKPAIRLANAAGFRPVDVVADYPYMDVE